MEIKLSLQEEELGQITGSASTCKPVKLLPPVVLTNCSGWMEQTLKSHSGQSSFIIETVVRLICLLSCRVSA